MRFQILFESLSSINYLLKQFGLSDATELLALFRLWLCENFILQVFQRELKMHFQILFESLSSINYLLKQFGLSDATELLTLFRLRLCENFILQVS